MSTDDKHLQVSETGYSNSDLGPNHDADVHSGSAVHTIRPGHIDHTERNRATPDPMAHLRQSAREAGEQRRAEEASEGSKPKRVRTRRSNLPSTTLAAVLGTGAVLFFVGVVAVILATNRTPPPPEVQELTVQDPEAEVAPVAEETEEQKELGGVPVRRGLRGE